MHTDKPRAFGVPFGVNLEKPEEAGWGIIFNEDTPQDVRKALEPLIAHRRKQVGDLLKALDYKKGEQTRSWYQRHRISPGSVDPEVVPYYLLLIGGPELIPFEFQYLLGVDYAVGRLAFDKADEYDRYVRSTIAYESGNAVPNTKEIAYWGTRHPGDPATNLSASLLIDPLANGVPGAAGALKRAIHTEVGYERKLSVADDATKANLLETLHARSRPRCCSPHRMACSCARPGRAGRRARRALCQDWPGFGSVKLDHILAASDIADDANVNGMVALIFACFGAGTPDADQFLMDLSQPGKPLAPKPFMAALPRRLLTHPNGSALAVIGHIDRAWGFSIQVAQGGRAADPAIPQQPRLHHERHAVRITRRPASSARASRPCRRCSRTHLADRAARHAAERSRARQRLDRAERRTELCAARRSGGAHPKGCSDVTVMARLGMH